jgi:acyl-CoA synthetase (AMP-forming)/AMP-acid ligase II
MSLTAEAFKVNTFIDVLTARAAETPEQIAYTFLQDGETPSANVSYQALDRQTRAIAAQLQSFNAQGTCVLILCRPGLDFIAAFLGCLYAGAIAVPSSPPRRIEKTARLKNILKDTQATLVLTTKDLLASLSSRLMPEPSQSPLHWIAIDALDPSQAETWKQSLTDMDTLAMLQYTSGSTGIPKGVMITHRNLMQNAKVLETSCAYGDSFVNVSWLPLFHDMGLMGNVLQSLYLGKPSFLMPSIAFIQKPVRWLQAISRYRATFSGGPNFAYDLLCRYVTPEQRATLDLSSWDVAFSGAEPIRAATLDRFVELFEPCGLRREALYTCYGMAEATCGVTGGQRGTSPTRLTLDTAALEKGKGVPTQAPGGGHRVVVGCGQPRLDIQIDIVDPTTLMRCADGTVGEVWVRGSNVAPGYWQQPAETTRTFQAYQSDTGDGPFLRTGDLGFIHSAELFITGRLKEVMIFWGLNRYPQHIEQTVEKSHPLFRANRGAAFSIPINGEDRLAIVYEIERNYRKNLPLEAAVESVRWNLAREHFLDVYAIVLLKQGQLPVTTSGKIQRQLCRSKFLEGSFTPIAEWRAPLDSQSDLRQLIKRYINPVTHLKRYFAILQGRMKG